MRGPSLAAQTTRGLCAGQWAGPEAPALLRPARALRGRGEAAWCPAIRLELWSGVGGETDRRILRDFEQALPELPMTDEVWAAADALAGRCRTAGKTAPAIDVLIAACARHHGVEVEHDDSHLDFLMTV